MRTITIHIQDGDWATAVTDLLNQGYTLSVPMNIVDNIERNAERVAVKERIKAQRAEADAFIAEREERNNRWRERDEERARKAAEREMFREVDELTVECRTCGAKVGDQCHKASGEFAQVPHVWRVRAAWEAKGR